jgi:hypothetical protein
MCDVQSVVLKKQKIKFISCLRVAFVYFVSYSKVKCHLSCQLSLKHTSQFKFTLLQFKIVCSEKHRCCRYFSIAHLIVSFLAVP